MTALPLPTDLRPLVGRHAEVRTFESLLARVTSNAASALSLSGEMGLGRTRLLHEYAAAGSKRGVNILLTQRNRQNEAPLAGLLGGFGAGQVEPVLAALRTPGHQDDQFGHVIEALAVSSANGPLLLLIDDLHTADDATRALVDRMLAAMHHGMLKGRPIGLIVSLLEGHRLRALEGLTALSGTGQPNAADPASETIMLRLAPFSDDEVMAWLQEQFQIAPDAGLVTLLVNTSKGNPLLLNELALHLKRSGLLSQRDGLLTSNVDPSGVTLPCDLTAMLTSKVESISGECRRAMTVAAFLGDQFSPATLAEVIGADHAALEAVLAEAEAAALIERRPGGAAAFKHATARDFFYATPDRRRRQAAHLEISERLIDEFGSSADEHCMTITHHLVRAGRDADPAKVLRFAGQAARLAFNYHAYFLAARYFEAAADAGADSLPLAACAELHCSAGEAFSRWSDSERSEPCFERAVRLYERCGDLAGTARALQGLLRVRINFGESTADQSSVAHELERLLNTLREGDTELRVRVNDTLAVYYHSIGKYTIAEAYAQTAMNIACNSPDSPGLRCIPVTSLALAQMEQLRMNDAKATWLEGLSFDRAAGASHYEGLHLQRLPIPMFCMGEVQEAARYNQTSYQHNRAIGNTGQLCLTLTVDLLIANLQGDFEAAVRLGQEAMALVTNTHYLWTAPSLIAALSYALTMRGRHNEAQAAVDHLRKPGLLFDDPTPYQGMAARLLALMAVHSGERTDDHTAPRTDPQRNWHGVRIGNVGLLCSEIEFALFEHDPERLSGLHDALVSVHRSGVNLTLDWCFSLPRSLAVSALLRGDPGRATSHFAEAEQLAERCNAPLERARVEMYRGLAAIAAPQPDLSAAARDLQNAAGTFEQFGAPALWRLAEEARTGIGAAGARDYRDLRMVNKLEE